MIERDPTEVWGMSPKAYIQRRVWILGAGFSRPLGGPLLDHLFAPNCLAVLRTRYRKERHQFPLLYESGKERLLGLLIDLYNFGLRLPGGAGSSGGQRWSNTEEYLDLLEAAAQPNVLDQGGNVVPETALAIHDAHARLLATILEAFPSGKGAWAKSPAEAAIPELARAGRLIMAAECSAFLNGAQLASESWQPYAEWLKCLTPTDCILTFNYDCAIETLGGDRIEVVLPDPESAARRRDEKPARPRLYKLHGSTDWHVDERYAPPILRRVEGVTWACLGCKPGTEVLATPGRTKRAVTKALEPLWTEAMDVVQNANEIAFVGYRFPQTDADARRRILSAIHANELIRKAHLVLGDNVDHPHMRRLRGLVVAARHGDVNDTVVAHPMWAEDFLSLADVLTGL